MNERRKHPPLTIEIIESAIHKAVTNVVPAAVDNSVTGKINKLAGELNNYIEKDIAWKEEDKQWKEKMQPVFESAKELGVVGSATKTGVSLYVGAKIVAGVLGTFGLIGSAIFALLKFFPK